MPRKKDRESATGLLPLMEARPWKDGKTVTYRYHPLGRPPISLGTDKNEAIRAVLDMNLKANDQGTIGQLWRLYSQSTDYAKLADITQKQYAEYWGRLAKVWEGGVVKSIKPADINKYLRVYRKGAQTLANREVALLSNLFNLAVELGDIDRNPCKEVRRNKERPRTRLVEAQELSAFTDWAMRRGPSAHVLVGMAEFAALAGSRRTEFLKLHWPQVDEEIIRLTRAKQRGETEKREIVFIGDALQEVLDRMRAQPGYNPLGAVFRAPKTGNPYSESGFKTMWGRLMDAALENRIIEKRFTFHDLRAHYTTYYKRRYDTLPDLHADPATTARVYERSSEAKRRSL
ncbi:MAG: tyrosine-type recombinase/integrase [Comamonas sp.]